MKQFFSRTILLWLLLCLWNPVFADTGETGEETDFSPEIDYMERMIDAVASGDDEAGREAQRCRDRKLAELSLAFPQVDYDMLSTLSRLIYAEAGSEWLDLEWKMAVGEVALNRTASPEFPDTIQEVAAQPGQYAAGLLRMKPNRESIEAALRLLEGERVLNDPAVVFQANTPQGSGVFLRLWDSRCGATYLCYSHRMELYES